jgi:hypothetical protein
MTPYGNRTRDVPVCSVVPQPTTPPLAPMNCGTAPIYDCVTSLYIHVQSYYFICGSAVSKSDGDLLA